LTTNCETQSAPDQVTVPRHSPTQSRSAAPEAALDFGRFRMPLRRRQLMADGEPVKLGTRAVWPGIHVSEESLKVQIFALRKALSEDRYFIRTETGRGYRFTAAVKSTVSRGASPHPDPRWQRQRQRTVSRWLSLSFPPCSHPNAHLSTSPKARLCEALAFAAGTALSTLSCTAYAALAGGSGTVQSLYDALLTTMKNGRTLGESGRFAELAPVIRSSFDVAAMARLSVGPLWTGLSEAQRQEVTESYGRYISAIYADRFDSYHGQKLEVTGEQSAPFGLLVTSRIVKSNGELVEVDYVMRRNGESWLISDVYLDSTISEVATRRSEFATILKTQGIDGLIAALNRKADILTGTTARSF
jgi:phospholipid transport system substrate-binding protein